MPEPYRTNPACPPNCLTALLCGISRLETRHVAALVPPPVHHQSPSHAAAATDSCVRLLAPRSGPCNSCLATTPWASQQRMRCITQRLYIHAIHAKCPVLSWHQHTLAMLELKNAQRQWTGVFLYIYSTECKALSRAQERTRPQDDDEKAAYAPLRQDDVFKGVPAVIPIARIMVLLLLPLQPCRHRRRCSVPAAPAVEQRVPRQPPHAAFWRLAGAAPAAPRSLPLLLLLRGLRLPPRRCCGRGRWRSSSHPHRETAALAGASPGRGSDPAWGGVGPTERHGATCMRRCRWQPSASAAVVLGLADTALLRGRWGRGRLLPLSLAAGLGHSSSSSSAACVGAGRPAAYTATARGAAAAGPSP